MTELYIFIFDFDLTLTNTHSNGSPYVKGSYISPEQNNNIIEIFNLIKTHNPKNKIIILSRGIQTLITKYLKKNHKYIFSLIDDIIGVNNIKDINTGNREYWADWKVKHIDNIKLKNNNGEIIFFDDTLENVIAAINKGYIAESIDSPYLLKETVMNTITKISVKTPSNKPTNKPTNKPSNKSAENIVVKTDDTNTNDKYKNSYIKYKTMYMELKNTIKSMDSYFVDI